MRVYECGFTYGYGWMMFSSNGSVVVCVNIVIVIVCYAQYSMLKSQYDSTDIYSDESSPSSQIVLRIGPQEARWRQLLFNVEAADFRVLHRGLAYPAHRAVIFKHVNLHVLDDETSEGCLTVPDSLNPHLLTGVLSVLYGYQLSVDRTEGLALLDVIHFLKISKLKRLLEEDILGNFEDYELFPLLERARDMGLQEVEDTCVEQLQAESFQQMRYAKYELLSCREDVFCFVLQCHSDRCWEDPSFGLPEKFLQQLIQEYCLHNGYSQRKKTLLLKSISQLTSSNIKFPSLRELTIKESSSIEIAVLSPRVIHTDSMIVPRSRFDKIKMQQGSKSMILNLSFMVNRKKLNTNNRNSEHNSSHSKMGSDVISVKEQILKQGRDIEGLRDHLEKIQQVLQQKEAEVSNHKFRLSQIENMLEECEKSMMENNRHCRLLEVKVNKSSQRQLKHTSSIQSEVTIDLSSDDDEEEEKEEHPRDTKLRVSLIESRWVCC